MLPAVGAPALEVDRLGFISQSKNLIPRVQTSRDVRLAVGIPLQLREQKQQPWSRTKRAARGGRRGVRRSKSLVEQFQAVRFREVFLLALVDAREGVKIRRQPPFVFREQTRNKFSR